MPIIRPISEAPTDGSVVLTDCGYAMLLLQKNWGSPVKNNTWVQCDPEGNIFSCADEGGYYCSPKLWTESPKWR